MSLKTIFENTIENGGVTIDRMGEVVGRSSGYVVAVANTETTIPASQFSYATFVTTLFDYASLLKSDSDLYTCHIGYWYNSENDTWYVDLSQVVDSKDIAIRLGKSRKQVAIFDLSSKQSIVL